MDYYYNNSENLINTHVGQGLKSEPVINKVSGGLNTNTGFDRIDQSINHILGTRKGERFFLPDFGSNLHLLLFERNSFLLEDLADLYIREALSQWEPRISVVSVTVLPSREENVVPINIQYRLSNLNREHNYVYPFVQAPMSLGGDSLDY